MNIPPHPAADASCADWLVGRIDLFAGGSRVEDEVGAGFEAYVRIGHPGADEEREVGNLAPRHLEILIEALGGGTTTPDQCWFAIWDGWGWLHGAVATLTFSTWDAAPVPPPAAPPEWQIDPRAPGLALPKRRYLLYGGPLRQALAVGYWACADFFLPQSPSLFWPDDHAWCVSTEIDSDYTLVGGSRILAETLLAVPGLDAVDVTPDRRP